MRKGERFKQLMSEAANFHGYLLQNIPPEIYEDALLMEKMSTAELELFTAWKKHRKETGRSS